MGLGGKEEVNGHQYILAAAGDTLLAFTLY
jgi:hypothetical protein